MQSRILYTFLFSIIALLGFSQENYHRYYETSLGRNFDLNEDTVFYHMNSDVRSDNVTIFGTTRFLEDNLTLVFSGHDKKGEVQWDREIDLGQDTVTIIGVGEIGFNETEDTLLFTINTEINGDPKQLYGKLSVNGQNLNLMTVGGNQFATLGAEPRLTAFFNNTNLLVTPGDRPTISRVDALNSVVWSRTYQFNDEDGNNVEENIIDITSATDTTFYVLGAHDDADNFLVSKMDSNGVQLWAEAYDASNFSQGALEKVTPTEIIALENGNVAVVGEALLSFGDIRYGFLSVMDTVGTVLLSKIVAANSDVTTEIKSSLRNIIVGSDDAFWMTGVYTENDSIRYFLTNVSQSGEQNWTTRYGEVTSDDPLSTTSLHPIDGTGGAIFAGHAFKNNIRILNVMKHNSSGATPCSDTMSVMIQDFNLMADTLTTSVVNGGLFFNQFEIETQDFGKFTPPTLIVDGNYIFCPNEMIDTFLVASVDGITDITYEWSTGEITDTIRVTEEGQYSVTVTIGEDVCFMMCDTVELTRSVIPTAAIGTVDNSRCENGAVIMDVDLGGTVQDGKPPFNYVWNTTEITDGINISTPGTYTVTVTDDCGDVTVASINVPMPVPNSNLVINTLDPCKFILSADYSSNLGTPVSYLWSTGESEQSITIDESGNYSVTVVDNCGDELETDLNVTVGSPDISVFFDVNPQLFCSDGTLEIIAGSPGSTGELMYAWSDGTNTYEGNPITVPAPEEGGSTNFSVTVTDECGDMATETMEVQSPILATEAEITYELSCNEDNSALNRISFQVEANGDVNVETYIVREDGQLVIESMNNPTPALNLAEYVVIVEDICGDELSRLELNATSICGGVLQYPKIFFPSGNSDNPEESVFGPIITTDTTSLIDRISNVEFKVYNRWGETVYEASSTDGDAILQHWDGNHKGDPAPSEVYIWYVSYILDEGTAEEIKLLDKGDITLVR